MKEVGYRESTVILRGTPAMREWKTEDKPLKRQINTEDELPAVSRRTLGVESYRKDKEAL